MLVFNSINDFMTENQEYIYEVFKNIVFVLGLMSSMYLIFGKNTKFLTFTKFSSLYILFFYAALVLMGHMIIESFVPFALIVILTIAKEKYFFK